MKIVHAVWEKRNLGRDAWEIFLGAEDYVGIDGTLKLLDDKRYLDSYVVIKLPVRELKLAHAVERAGFEFMETQLELRCDLAAYSSPAYLQRFKGYLNCYAVTGNNEEWSAVAQMIDDEMFVSDRVYLDEKLAHGMSAKRYRNWVMDMRENARAIMLVARNSRTGGLEGFEVDVIDGEIVKGLIGGAYSHRPPLGMLRIDAMMTKMAEMGKKALDVVVSTNNLPVLQCFTRLGASITNGFYVFRRICGGERVKDERGVAVSGGAGQQ